ncbi:type II CRISPR RNA-guided endonuclease Cas9 [Parvimonas micra]|uniref:type II CRISPR RNA-guided endonuclease Cas9 n=1 Tax=Parvimonas micra TaxID=33033 RepID=UPI0020044DEE|nr:type II CRISPR RNA-guided endonuclease Cas9 [Parvimonas micra]MCK6130773.1 type II CRISPR RNA-guided endonuclease Cas9 [Parvimonas micra]MCK6136418.1 type II CRISPR RNA-guided endonuclease Cas9 [Parvimonas micra]MCK6137889.1 type II CRISPR RNA-guided endonuclease Cas9 [Parvimonas micra]MCK6154417.1 type II CRISPR RNA-guided endonuclease Cas9 [Parvimonas micra]
MGKQEFNDYYLGFDIGTNSVGWAVTDQQYKLLRFNKKDMWGSRLFEEAKTAKDRRVYRNSRRRLDRRKRRLKLLEELFLDEISKVDNTFFKRLEESNLYNEDKSIKFNYPLFNDKDYTDINFYNEYKTIYHLRKDLIFEDKKFDIRLVFIVLHHILKYRGHFIFEGQSFEDIKSFDSIFTELSSWINENFEIEIDINLKERIEEIILSDNTKSIKKTEFKKIFSDNRILAILNMGVGCKVDLKDVFNNEELKDQKISFAEIDYENEKRDEFYQLLGENIYIVDLSKKIYDFMILKKILKNSDSFSESKVALYCEHKDDLDDLKYIFKKYLKSSDYYKFFRSNSEKINYPSYIGLNKIKTKRLIENKKCSISDINKELKNKYLKDIQVEAEDEELFNHILHKLDENKFLEKLKSSENSTVPYQVYEIELKKILDNQRKYHSFLNEKSDGMTICEKIIKLFEFRIPYYVGPLNTDHNVKGENTWIVRKDEDSKSPITPWNFDEKVDKQKSAEEFIKRMTNRCTYLRREDVIPKNSLLYEEFVLLNELNKVTVDNELLHSTLKNEIIDELFKTTVKITKKKFVEFLKKKQAICDVDSITGVDVEFNGKLQGYNTFRKILGEKIENLKVKNFVERCIELKCLYGSDKELFEKAVGDLYKKYNITDEEFTKINKLNFNKWGRLSKEFLTSISFEKTDGTERFESVIEALRSTNYNLMELLSDKFNLKSKIDEVNGEDDFSNIDIKEYVNELYVSPSVKRSIIQTYKIAMEIKKITGKNPKKVFIEMAKGGGEKGKRTEKRKDKIKELYKNMKDSLSDYCNNLQDLSSQVEKYDDNRLRQKKLFLYFMQMGKSMYTGNDIDLSELFNNNIYDIDHIYPQSKLKDDSFDNIVLVEKQENHSKSNELLKPEIQSRMNNYWIFLRENKFISKEKYNRLTRKKNFTDEELGDFVARQLVTTRQSTKEVAKLFEKIFDGTEVVYSKASLVSDFRERFDIIKVREVNDAHHAQDAYLNIVVGNVFNTKFTKNYWKFIREVKNKNEENPDKKEGYNFEKIYESDVFRNENVAWVFSKENKEINTINTVNKMVYRKTVNITEMLVEGKGQLFNLTIKDRTQLKKKVGNIVANIPKSLKNRNRQLKNDELAKKYGYFDSLNNSYFVLFKYEEKGKEKIGFDGITIVDKEKLKDNSDIEEFLENKGNKNAKLIRKIFKNQKVLIDGYPYLIKSFNKQSQIKFNNFKILYLDETNLKFTSDAIKFEKNNANVDLKKQKYIVSFLKKKKQNEINETYEECIARLNNEFDILFLKLCDIQKSPIYTNYKLQDFSSNKKSIEIKDKFDIFKSLDLYNKSKLIKEFLNYYKYEKNDLDFGLIDIDKKTNCLQKTLQEDLIKDFVIVDESVTGLFVKKERLE